MRTLYQIKVRFIRTLRCLHCVHWNYPTYLFRSNYNSTCHHTYLQLGSWTKAVRLRSCSFLMPSIIIASYPIHYPYLHSPAGLISSTIVVQRCDAEYSAPLDRPRPQQRPMAIQTSDPCVRNLKHASNREQPRMKKPGKWVVAVVTNKPHEWSFGAVFPVLKQAQPSGNTQRNKANALDFPFL